MATYVLVHGGNMSADTWNKLAGRNDYPPGGRLGKRCWDGTVAALAARGHRVFAPALGEESGSTLTEHVRQVRRIIEADDLRKVVLVGHSYGGMVITGVAAQVPERIGRLVYVDAALPDPGESLYDLLNAGLSAGTTINEVRLPEPSPPYVERLQFDAAMLAPLPKTYVQCMKSDFLPVTRLVRRKIAAAPQGWTCVELACSHVPMADLAGPFERLLLDAATERGEVQANQP